MKFSRLTKPEIEGILTNANLTNFVARKPTALAVWSVNSTITEEMK